MVPEAGAKAAALGCRQSSWRPARNITLECWEASEGPAKKNPTPAQLERLTDRLKHLSHVGSQLLLHSLQLSKVDREMRPLQVLHPGGPIAHWPELVLD
jgi:hypothetical protein